jgi:ABC-type amino acid transport substrate-binding protein
MQYFIILLSFLLFTGCEKKSSEKDISEKEKKILNIAVSSDYPPYIYTKDAKLAGFEIEIINAVAQSLKKTISFHDIAFEGIIPTVAKGQVDGAISSIARTPEREKEVDFSIPYHRSMTVVIVPFATSIRSVDDLDDKVVGVEKGTTYENDIKKKFKDVKLLARAKFHELLDALQEGKCQAIVTGYSEAYELQNINPNLKILPIEGTTITFSIALPKGSAWLVPINDTLQAMIKNGDIRKLETQFFKKVIKE